MDQTNASCDNEASKKREREDEDEEIDEAKQKELDDAFLDACSEGSLKDVKSALRAGGFSWLKTSMD